MKEIVQTKDSKVNSMPRSKILLNWIARYSDLQFMLNQTVFLSEWDLSHWLYEQLGDSISDLLK